MGEFSRHPGWDGTEGHVAWPGLAPGEEGLLSGLDVDIIEQQARLAALRPDAPQVVRQGHPVMQIIERGVNEVRTDLL